MGYAEVGACGVSGNFPVEILCRFLLRAYVRSMNDNFDDCDSFQNTCNGREDLGNDGMIPVTRSTAGCVLSSDASSIATKRNEDLGDLCTRYLFGRPSASFNFVGFAAFCLDAFSRGSFVFVGMPRLETTFRYVTLLNR